MRIKIYIGPMDPAPEGFRRRFILDGWRGVEHWYGARTAVNRRWAEECGGLAVLQAERRAYRDAQRASVAGQGHSARQVRHA
ncbi:hypothetical protein [Sphingomonas sp.]|uniref:hypothetical protein n=1 Tax=Sphingomonas sp. TaxID=28214 RepID=UPI003F71DA56